MSNSSDCQFPCRNGNCVLSSDFRDGQDDCGDYSDEECLPWYYTCPKTGVCISAQTFATGNYNCSLDVDYCSSSTLNDCSPLARCENSGIFYKCICLPNITRDVSINSKYPGRACVNITALNIIRNMGNANNRFSSNPNNIHSTISNTSQEDILTDCDGFRWGRNIRLCVPRSYGIILILFLTFVIAALLFACCLSYWLFIKFKDNRIREDEERVMQPAIRRNERYTDLGGGHATSIRPVGMYGLPIDSKGRPVVTKENIIITPLEPIATDPIVLQEKNKAKNNKVGPYADAASPSSSTTSSSINPFDKKAMIVKESLVEEGGKNQPQVAGILYDPSKVIVTTNKDAPIAQELAVTPRRIDRSSIVKGIINYGKQEDEKKLQVINNIPTTNETKFIDIPVVVSKPAISEPIVRRFEIIDDVKNNAYLIDNNIKSEYTLYSDKPSTPSPLKKKTWTDY
ncbi:unnamed protein product [Gordionus sp. m RMFG-2023]